MSTAVAHNREISNHLDKAQEDLTPLRVYELFKKITDEDAVILWLNPQHGRPESLLLHNLLVPPVPIRPSVAMEVGGGSNEDDLTTQLVEILQVCTYTHTDTHTHTHTHTQHLPLPGPVTHIFHFLFA